MATVKTESPREKALGVGAGEADAVTDSEISAAVGTPELAEVDDMASAAVLSSHATAARSNIAAPSATAARAFVPPAPR
jgi:hypothetical protein